MDGELTESGRERLVSDLRAVVADTEEILKATASQAGEKWSDARVRLQDRLIDAKRRLADAEDALRVRTKAAARATDDYVHENPWRAVGVAAAAGIILGMLISRR